MKNIFGKALLIFAFILLTAIRVFAADLNITSVTYDNSSAFLSINTFDNEDYSFSASPKLYIVEDENKAYFDISSAVLKCPAQDLVLTSAGIKEIMVKQFSTNPNIVRVVIYYNEGFNPNDIQLRKLNNTLFVRFNHPQLQNYYFQHVYAENSGSVKPVYENINIQSPVLASQNNVLNQINSAFNIGNSPDAQNYVLTKKDLILPTKYYIDNITLKNGTVHITGIGSLTLVKPIHLTNPDRAAFDIPGAIVNPSVRNKEVFINQNETIKIGQFDKDMARIVITSPNALNYVPIIFGDTQRLVFADKSSGNIQSISSAKSVLRSINDEINDLKSHSIKLVFSKPILYGFEKTSKGLEVNLYNVDKMSDIDIKSAFIFEGIQLEKTNKGFYRLTIPDIENIDVHAGVDAKTLRLKIKHSTVALPEKVEPVIVVEPVVPHRAAGKKYVVIDPGHGGSDCGATRNGIYEKNITLDVSKRVAELLKKKGYEVVMTRSSDETVSLQERVEISENVSPDVFVSIHVNSSSSEAPNGLETHYYKDNSLMLAKTVHASMLNHIKANNRGLFKSKFYVINHTTAPAILVEIGFISNSAERGQLVSESRKQATAKAIAEGINDYFK
ncbi:MAG: N-acetylmuramoyl-L-alanine amidase [Candidatus Gastranaerophilaceae bacterium]